MRQVVPCETRLTTSPVPCIVSPLYGWVIYDPQPRLNTFVYLSLWLLCMACLLVRPTLLGLAEGVAYRYSLHSPLTRRWQVVVSLYEALLQLLELVPMGFLSAHWYRLVSLEASPFNLGSFIMFPLITWFSALAIRYLCVLLYQMVLSAPCTRSEQESCPSVKATDEADYCILGTTESQLHLSG
jgi:hypothetical protein